MYICFWKLCTKNKKRNQLFAFPKAASTDSPLHRMFKEVEQRRKQFVSERERFNRQHVEHLQNYR